MVHVIFILYQYGALFCCVYGGDFYIPLNYIIILYVAYYLLLRGFLSVCHKSLILCSFSVR